MKWIGQYIQDLISRFRHDVYLESLSTTTESNVLVVDSNGKISKNTSVGGGITSVVAGTLFDGGGTTGDVTLNVDLTEAAEAAIVADDYMLFLDGGATGTHAKENMGDLATAMAGTGLTAQPGRAIIGSIDGTTITVVNANAWNVTNQSYDALTYVRLIILDLVLFLDIQVR